MRGSHFCITLSLEDFTEIEDYESIDKAPHRRFSYVANFFHFLFMRIILSQQGIDCHPNAEN